MTTDNRAADYPADLPELGISNRSHVHHYVVKGGPTYWAECECGHKLTDGGVIAGSEQKVKRAIESHS